MKKFTLLFFLVFLSMTFSAQKMTEYQFGTPFKISYPIDYIKVYDLNDVAAAQFSNAAANKYGIVIQTEKDNLTFAQIGFANILEAGNFYIKNLKDGLEVDDILNQSVPKEITINGYNAVETTVEGTFLEAESKGAAQLFYYFVLVETPKNYYQILFWTDLKNKNKHLDEFRRSASTFKELK